MDWFTLNIREIRHMRSYSQEFMAFELGIHTSNYNRIETGIQQARVSRIVEIAKILNVQPYELFIDKTIRKRLECAQYNEYRLAELEKEVLELRRILFASSNALQASQFKLNTSPNDSGFQAFIS